MSEVKVASCEADGVSDGASGASDEVGADGASGASDEVGADGASEASDEVGADGASEASDEVGMVSAGVGVVGCMMLLEISC